MCDDSDMSICIFIKHVTKGQGTYALTIGAGSRCTFFQLLLKREIGLVLPKFWKCFVQLNLKKLWNAPHKGILRLEALSHLGFKDKGPAIQRTPRLETPPYPRRRLLWNLVTQLESNK